MLTVTKRFNFSYAHHLPGHSHCGEVHGHNGVLDVTVTKRTEIGDDGMIIDFADLDATVTMEVLEYLDHKDLNKLHLLKGITIGVPTAENIVAWIVYKLEKALKNDEVELMAVRLYETPDNWAEWRADG